MPHSPAHSPAHSHPNISPGHASEDTVTFFILLRVMALSLNGFSLSLFIAQNINRIFYLKPFDNPRGNLKAEFQTFGLLFALIRTALSVDSHGFFHIWSPSIIKYAVVLEGWSEINCFLLYIYRALRIIIVSRTMHAPRARCLRGVFFVLSVVFLLVANGTALTCVLIDKEWPFAIYEIYAIANFITCILVMFICYFIICDTLNSEVCSDHYRMLLDSFRRKWSVFMTLCIVPITFTAYFMITDAKQALKHIERNNAVYGTLYAVAFITCGGIILNYAILYQAWLPLKCCGERNEAGEKLLNDGNVNCDDQSSQSRQGSSLIEVL